MTTSAPGSAGARTRYSRRMVWSEVGAEYRRLFAVAVAPRVAVAAAGGRRAAAVAPVVLASRRSTRQPPPPRGPDATSSASCSTRSARRPTRTTATASTTSPGPSRSTCSTRGRSAGRPWPSAPGASLRSSSDAFDDATGRFRNFRAIDGSWLDGPASEDCQGRAMLALGDAIADRARAAPRAERDAALFERRCPRPAQVDALRGAGVGPRCGCDAAIRGGPARGDDRDAVRRLAWRTRRRSCHSRPTRVPSWPWPEPSLTYENALLAAGADRRRAAYSALAADGRHRAAASSTGSSTSRPRRRAPVPDRQRLVAARRRRVPVRPAADRGDGAAARGEAALRRRPASPLPRRRWSAPTAGSWARTTSASASPIRPAARCHDGLTPAASTRNQGAESTLMWLIGRSSTSALRRASAAPADRDRRDARSLDAASRSWRPPRMTRDAGLPAASCGRPPTRS